MNKPNTVKYDCNEGRKERISYYRNLVNLDEDAEITEDNIVPWAFDKTCCRRGVEPERLKAELLGRRWSDLEDYED